MASAARPMKAQDMMGVKRLIGGDIPPNFLSVVYERDREVIGWVCCSVENKQAVVHAAVARGFSGFAGRQSRFTKKSKGRPC